MSELTILYVECESFDEFIAGTDGNVEQLIDGPSGCCRLLISTDVPDVVEARLDNDDNVVTYEVCLGSDAEMRRNAW